ncbi:MAG: hypothetical protein FJW39_26180 [Acidobacteria bacterium]|nr:hypothetical protein [Acidobacteriota bacterium]
MGRTLKLVAGGVLAGAAIGPVLLNNFAGIPVQASLIALCGIATAVAGALAAATPGLQALRTSPADVVRHE